jgi:hypothetical protein
VSFGLLNGNLGVVISHLLSTNKGEVLASPQITTLDNKEARIFMGDQVPVLSKDVSGNTITTYVEAEVTRRVSGAPTTARSERRPVAGWVVRMSGRDLEFQTSNGVSFYARVHGRTDSSNPTGMDAWWRVGIDGRPLLSGRSETSTLAQFAAEDALFALSDGIRRGTGGIP